MKTPDNVLDIFKPYSSQIELEIEGLMDDQKEYQMYDMMRYFFGFMNKELEKDKSYGGKRFRSGVCLYIADIFGKRDDALAAATAIEVFHNFTLIHDDIIDNDPLRRGRETVWKLWGTDQAINTGDAQFLLSIKELNKLRRLGTAGERTISFLLQVFQEIVEGQYLDIFLTDINIDHKDVNEEKYLLMIKNKTSVIIGGATKAAGIISGVSEKDENALWDYGVNLGIAYQLCDDLVSIWGDPEITGKIAANDLLAKKKTLPVIHLFNSISADKKQKLTRIYNKKGDLTQSEVVLFTEEMDRVNSYEYTWKKLEEYKEKSISAVAELSIQDKDKKILIEIVDALLPNVKEICKC